MPNWVKQRVTFHGENESLKKFVEAITVQQADNDAAEKFNKEFTFETVELPSGNKIEASNFHKQTRTLGSVSFNKLVPEPDNLFRSNISSEQEEWLSEHGYPSWYKWHNANWDTKWDACDPEVRWLDDNDVEIEFDTAWSCPYSVWYAIGELAESLGIEFEGVFADEDFGGAMGCMNKELGDEIYICHADYDHDIYRDVWGIDIEEDLVD